MAISSKTRLRATNFINSPKFKNLNPETQRRLYTFLQSGKGVQFGGGKTRGAGATGMFGEPTFPQQILQNLKQAGQRTLGTAQQVANVGAFGIPEIVSQRTTGKPFVGGGFAGGQVPQGSDKVAADILGFTLGGPGRVVSKTSQLAKRVLPSTRVIPQMFKGAAVGGVAGATQFPLEKERIKTGVVIGGLIPPLGFIGGRAIRGTSDFFRAIAGVGKETVNQVKRLGFKRVVDPAKRTAGYIGNTLVPRIKQSVTQNLTRFTSNTRQMFNKLGVSNRAVNDLRNIGYGNLQNLKKRLGGTSDSLVTRAKGGIDLMVNNAKQRYNVVFDKMIPEKANFNIKGIYNVLKAELGKLGIVDKNGNVIKPDFPEMNKTINIYQNVVRYLTDPNLIKSTNALRGARKSDYVLFRSLLDNAESSNPSINRIIYRTSRVLRQGAAKQFGILREANKLYAQAINLKETYSEKINQRLFDRFTKLPLEQRRYILDLEKQLPKQYKFIKDLNALNSVNEIDDVLAKEFSDRAIENNLGRVSQFAGAKSVAQNRVKDIYQHLPNGTRTIDDALSSYLAKDLFQETVPSGFMGMAGAVRKGTEAGVRGYLAGEPVLRNIAPIFEAVKRKLTPF